MRDHPAIISITGTKGKSTVTYLMADILQRYGETVLRVDTTGYYINGEQKGTPESSKRVARLVPTVCPGRFLTAMEQTEHFTAVLECSIGCSNPPGLGYYRHSIGIFTNVFEDHLGSTSRLNSQADIAEAKSFIFSRLASDGTAVFNADDAHVCSKLPLVPKTAQLIPCGIDFSAFDLPAHLAKGGIAITYVDGVVVCRTANGDEPLFAATDILWTFGGAFMPSILNSMYIAGGLLGYFNGKVPAKVWELLKGSRLDPYGGRLTLLRAKNGATIIADYAHEKTSLVSVAGLARHLAGQGGRVIGVVRLAYDRTDELITQTAEAIAPHFDEFVVYDKIDGHWRKPVPTDGRFTMAVGRISDILASAIKRYNPHVTRIVREDEAIAHAAKLSGPRDVVVVIVNDNIRRSIDFITDSFNATFM